MTGRVVYLSEIPVKTDVVLFSQEPDMMDVPRVAEVLGVSEATVRREIARGVLQCVHVGSRVLVTKKALLRYVGEE